MILNFYIYRSALADVTNELEERQHRWSQIESLCGFQIMSQTSFGIGKGNGTRPRTGSAIAQALVNVANVAGVSSGRKISSSASPWKMMSDPNTVAESKEDLPPTYSTATAKIAVADVSEREESSVDLSCQEHGSVNCGGLSETGATSAADVETGHSRHNLDAEAMMNGLTASQNTRQSLEHVLLSGVHLQEDELTTNSVSSDSPPGKSKKRLSWFGKRQDSTTESESSSAAENEEETRKKVRWLWRSAVRKSKAQRNTTSKSESDGTNATSLEKLKSG